MTNAQCKFAAPGVARNIFDSTLCTFKQPQQGICFGDSGGPLLYQRFIVGIASFVIKPCATGKPDGWARVSSYRDYINNIIR